MGKQQNNLKHAKREVKKLFAVMSIENIVHIDDEYEINLDDLANELLSMHPAKRSRLENVPDFVLEQNDFEPDIFRQQLKNLLEDEPERYQNLQQEIVTSKNSSNEIQSLFSDLNFYALSPSIWQSQSDKFLEENFQSSTLYLFDLRLDISNPQDEGGLRLINEVLNSHENIYCGLISNSFTPEEEYDVWLNYTSKGSHYYKYQHRFALISKQHNEDYLARVESIRRIILNEKAHTFINEAVKQIQKAYEEAYNEIKDLNIYDLEGIIFQSSYKEGVWEFDTLSRLVTIVQRKKIIEYSKKSDELNKIADEMRQITNVKSGSETTPMAKQVRTQELYDEHEIVNTYNLPIELGDIFVLNEKSYILLNQPCDLMVRDNGKRSAYEGILVEIVNQATSINELSGEIKYFENYQDAYVDFRKAHIVDMRILDLVVLNKSGQALFNNEPVQIPRLINSWQARYQILSIFFQRQIELAQQMHKLFAHSSESNVSVSHLAPLSLLLNFSRTLEVKPSLEDNIITYPIKRIKRLRQPYAGSILTKYANSTARDAFEHDFAR